MSYISQAIVFVLAVMGVLFKSIQTDKDGKTIHTASGLPVLTKTGRTVIFLLVLSFLVSLLTTRQKSKTDETQKKLAQEAQASLTHQLHDVTQQNEGLKSALGEVVRTSATMSQEQRERFSALLKEQKQAGTEIAQEIQGSADILQTELNKTAQQLLEERVREISAVVTFSFDTSVLEEQRSLPPNILSKGVELEIVGISPTEPYPKSLSKGWVDGFLIHKEDFLLTAWEQSFDTRSYPSTAGPYIEQIRTFSNFNADLKEFERLARWKGAILEARLLADPIDGWLKSLVKTNESHQAWFDNYYGVTAETHELWDNSDTDVSPIPVSAKLELFINKHKIQTTEEWRGWLAKVRLGDEDVRNLCIIKFPLVRVKFQGNS